MASETTSISNFAFIDLETTGLPSYENNTTKITELNVTIIESQHLRLGVYPRVRNKLHLCLNPCKFISPGSTDITKLSNEILENQPYFSSDIVNTINNFLDLNKKPICLVAHNGYKFDYPILKAELDNVEGALPDDILCMDSLECFKDLHYNSEIVKTEPETSVKNYSFDDFTNDEVDKLLCDAMDDYEKKMSKVQKLNETTPKKRSIQNSSISTSTTNKNIASLTKKSISFKLCDIYERLALRKPENSHDAEGDVECMIYCAANYGDKFVDWANKNAKLFSTIKRMRPGIRF